MSNKVVILSDSTCDLGEELLKKYSDIQPYLYLIVGKIMEVFV